MAFTSKRALLSQFLILVLALNLYATIPVDFYATVSSSKDSNMLRMTTDLFFTQFQALDGYTVNDKRDTNFSEENAVSSNIAFYAEIQEDSAGGWLCTLNAIKKSGNKNVSITKKYASYYKILMDAKSSLENLLANLNSNLTTQNELENKTSLLPQAESPALDLDFLAGTWTGEEAITKIILTRGGRGFIIFKNGASMNVSVELENSGSKTIVVIKQTTRANASFFTELSRSLALQSAVDAPAIEWNLTLISDDTLEGTKKTLLEDPENPGKVKSGTVSIKWKKTI